MVTYKLHDLRWHQLGLRARLSIMVVGAVTLVVGITSTYFIVGQRQAMMEQMESRSRVMREELGKKGLAVASTVALASERALAVKDFLFLAQIVQTTQASDAQFVYGALVNGEGLALVHTDRDFAGKRLDGDTGSRDGLLAAAQVRDAVWRGRPIMEVVDPVQVAGKRWGVVRFGLSLDRMNAEIEAQQQSIAARMRMGVMTSLLVSVVLTAAGIFLGTEGAKVLTRPLGKLMEGVQDLRAGKVDSTVVVKGTPEFVALARAFNDMTLAVKRREGALQSALAAADEANRLKSEFLANISHELRTPLNAILNVPAALLEDFQTFLLWKCPACEQTFEPDEGTVWAEGLTEPCPACGASMTFEHQTFFTGKPADHKRYNERALTSGQHLLRVVNDLLDFSRLQAGKMEIFPEDVKVSDLINDIRDTMQSLADAKRINLTADVPAVALDLHLDRVKMGQVLINLLGNAIKFTPDGGRVILRMTDGFEGDANQVHFMVEDTGIGIPEDKLQVIFEPFRQADGSHTRSHGGTGLGLAITDQIIKLHGGRVWAESREGFGSTFHVVVPRRAGRVMASPEVKAKPAVFIQQLGRPGRVVMVDDDGIYLELGKRMLSEAGLQVDVVADPTEAYDQIASSHPDFVIIDVMMPRVSGIEVLKRLKTEESTRDIPVLVSTAFYANQGIVTRLGGIWLPKPWGPGEFADCLVRNKILSDATVHITESPNGGSHGA